jgi:hypothetical protein
MAPCTLPLAHSSVTFLPCLLPIRAVGRPRIMLNSTPQTAAIIPQAPIRAWRWSWRGRAVPGRTVLRRCLLSRFPAGWTCGPGLARVGRWYPEPRPLSGGAFLLFAGRLSVAHAGGLLSPKRAHSGALRRGGTKAGLRLMWLIGSSPGQVLPANAFGESSSLPGEPGGEHAISRPRDLSASERRVMSGGRALRPRGSGGCRTVTR